MRDIAEAADLSAANLYHYFDGKNDLLFYCQDRALDRLLDAVAQVRRATPSAVERLRRVFVAHVRTLLDEVEGAAAHLQIDALSPPQRAAIIAKRDRYERALRRIVSDGVRSGELVATDAAIVVRASLGALNWTVTWFRPEGEASAEDVADVVARFLVRGLAARTPAVTRRLSLVASPRRASPA